jgi:ankyrin repeat protein
MPQQENTALHMAALTGHMGVMIELLAKGADIEAKNNVSI